MSKIDLNNADGDATIPVPKAKKMIQNGGLSINKEKVTTIDFTLKTEHLLNNHYILIQKGKSNYTLAIFN